MAKKFIAVDGFTITISNPIVDATLTLTGVPSIKNKASGNGICKDGFGVTVTNVTALPSASIPAPGPYNVQFSATALKTKADGTLVLRVDDETSIINATPKIPGSPPVDFPVSFKLIITNAGQSKVRSE